MQAIARLLDAVERLAVAQERQAVAQERQAVLLAEIKQQMQEMEGGDRLLNG